VREISTSKNCHLQNFYLLTFVSFFFRLFFCIWKWYCLIKSNNNNNFSFRFAFPFGRPEGALKATLSLLERVLSKDIVTPISRDEIRHFIRKCLENAAYTNYTRVSDQAKIEGKFIKYICINSIHFSGEREVQQQNDNGKCPVFLQDAFFLSMSIRFLFVIIVFSYIKN